ncbi:hypothetical protein K461DRAFT_317756 [Myriangium duriaei CBS 260.36]|uniref:HMG box domain-containing protein n=1 Tax=Myriangium duriaei CBS 260.36 TaxID=1168546 RepID=A0A9P4JCQ6_9PEZI|nr:hypothetical protein K461DRAFT_317756 [Myriangium duriaei CBS 260.36]
MSNPSQEYNFGHYDGDAFEQNLSAALSQYNNSFEAIEDNINVWQSGDLSSLQSASLQPGNAQTVNLTSSDLVETRLRPRKNKSATVTHLKANGKAKLQLQPPKKSRSRTKRSKEEAEAELLRLGVPMSFSEFTKDWNIPVEDIEALVHRTPQKRLQEAQDKGKIPRPSNSFILYRSAYTEKTKVWAKTDNHQVISKFLGLFWAIEPQGLKDRYAVWADIDKANHQLAFPSYKYEPQQSRNKRAIDSDDEDGSESGTADPDAEWTPSGRLTSKNKRRRVVTPRSGLQGQQGTWNNSGPEDFSARTRRTQFPPVPPQYQSNPAPAGGLDGGFQPGYSSGIQYPGNYMLANSNGTYGNGLQYPEPSQTGPYYVPTYGQPYNDVPGYAVPRTLPELNTGWDGHQAPFASRGRGAAGQNFVVNFPAADFDPFNETTASAAQPNQEFLDPSLLLSEAGEPYNNKGDLSEGYDQEMERYREWGRG